MAATSRTCGSLRRKVSVNDVHPFTSFGCRARRNPESSFAAQRESRYASYRYLRCPCARPHLAWINRLRAVKIDEVAHLSEVVKKQDRVRWSRKIVALSVVLALGLWYGPSSVSIVQERIFLSRLDPGMSRESLYSLCRELHVAPYNWDYAVKRQTDSKGSYKTLAIGEFPEPKASHTHPDVSLDFYPTPELNPQYDIDQVHVRFDQSNRVSTWTKTSSHTGW
jgi:hypothetical protein